MCFVGDKPHDMEGREEDCECTEEDFEWCVPSIRFIRERIPRLMGWIVITTIPAWETSASHWGPSRCHPMCVKATIQKKRIWVPPGFARLQEIHVKEA